MDNFCFPKEEKLKGKKLIDSLFKNGEWFSCGTIRIISYKNDDKIFKLGVSVSKKFFKKAVERNRLKRLLRESYRLNKTLFKDSFGEHSVSMIFWVTSKLPQNFNEVERAFIKLCDTKSKKKNTASS